MSGHAGDADIRDIAIKREALLENGHFLLSSGLHSDKYFQCAKILEWPEDAGICGRRIAEKITAENISADLVLAPAMGGLFVGYETARALGIRSLFLERLDGTFKLRRGFDIKAGEKVLIIEDVLTTGKSTLEVKEFVANHGKGTVVGVGCITERVRGDLKKNLLAELGVPLVSLLEVSAKTLEPSVCPGCKEGKPLIKPGSRA